MLKDEREQYSTGGGDDKGMPTVTERYDAVIDNDIKILNSDERESYLNSGTGFFGTGFGARAGQALGGFGEGKRLVQDLKDVKRQMYDDTPVPELINRINSRFAEAGVDYIVSDKFGVTKKAEGGKVQFAEGGSLLADDMLVEEELPIEETHTMPDGTEMPGETHIEEDIIPEEPEVPMESDDNMEDGYLDFILDEALSEEEEDMLMSRLEQDEELSMLFDKVIDVAQEFAGSGPVEGPGSGVSDSIPARLSDGEFVFTTAAVEEIGADNLMAMMKDAEMKAEERQGLAEGGEPDEETVTMKVQEQKEPKVQIAKATVNSTKGLLDEDEISKGIKSKMMLDPNQRHVRS